jgi:hypothetical protein
MAKSTAAKRLGTVVAGTAKVSQRKLIVVGSIALTMAMATAAVQL